MLASFKSFFASTQGSIKGFLNPEELFRSILTSLGSATTIGIMIVVLQTTLTNVGAIFPDPHGRLAGHRPVDIDPRPPPSTEPER